MAAALTVLCIINANGKRTAPTQAPSHLRLLQLLEQEVEFGSASSTNNT